RPISSPSTLFAYTPLFRSTDPLGGRPEGDRKALGARRTSVFRHRWNAATGGLSSCASCASCHAGRSPVSPPHWGESAGSVAAYRSEEHTTELQSRENLVSR